MKRLALILAICGLVIGGTAGADQTCKVRATKEKLTGEALWREATDFRPAIRMVFSLAWILSGAV